MMRVRFLLAVLLGVLAGGAGLLAPATAHADSTDRVTTWEVAYVVDTEGAVHVTETMTWDFTGVWETRHGIERDLIIREPWDRDHDAVYGISDISVTSPTASTMVNETTDCSDDNRTCQLVLRIGDPNITLPRSEVTWTLSYTVEGALRTGEGFDEFYWDVVGAGTPLTNTLDVTVEVPGGVLKADCWTGARGATTECTSQQILDGVAHFTQEEKPRGAGVTIDAALPKGAVAQVGPRLEAKALTDEDIATRDTFISVLISSVLAFATATIHSRRRRNPEITVPETGPATTWQQPPQAPEIPVAMAGLLHDGLMGSTEVAATLVDLAVRGVIQLSAPDEDYAPSLCLADLSSASDTERRLLKELCGSGIVDFASNQVVTLDDHTRLAMASEVLGEATTTEALARGLLAQAGTRPGNPATGVGAVVSGLCVAALLVVWVFLLGSSTEGGSLRGLGIILGFMIPAGIGLASIVAASKRAQLSEAGAQQVAILRTLRVRLQSDENHEARLDPDDDTFSRFLPWAIVLGVSDAWTRRFQRLGSLQPQTPWLNGTWTTGQHSFVATVRHTAETAPAGSSSSSGGGSFSSSGGGSFSSGSGFSGGGGYSGGGGGGGGARSW